MSILAKYEQQLHDLVIGTWGENANLVFRGQADHKWGLVSSADRQSREVSLRDYIKTHLLDRARAEGYGHRNGKRLTDLELLAALQHHGAATNLIDFTTSFHISVWFACQGRSRDGTVFVVNRGDINSFETIMGEPDGVEIEKILADDDAVNTSGDALRTLKVHKIFCWTPPPSETRFVVQHSCFVFSKHRITKELYKTIRVHNADKSELLQSLRLYYGLEAQTVFRDFTGFARSLGVGGVAVDSRTATEWFMMGRDYFQRRQYAMAIEYYDRAIQMMDPPNCEYLEQRGITYLAERRYKLAIKDFSAAIELDDKNPVYYELRGRACSANREYEASILDFDRAIALNPTEFTYYHSRGNAKRYLMRYEEALNDYSKMIEVDESARSTSLYSQAMVRKDWWEATSDQDKLEAAVQDLNEVLTIKSGTKHNVYFQRALIRKALGKREGTIEDLKAARDAVKSEVNTVWAPGSRDAFLEQIERELRELNN